ncbi:MAG: zf-HC2 domain-containing protein [bacterium]|nr:zf-HC2 domain-containing protein [bacterium]
MSISNDCQDAIELLPWFLNGSLDGDERQALHDHLATCESCRSELEQTTRAWEVFAQHVPSLALAEYAEGLEPSELNRERIEQHLARCPSCRQELEWATADRVVDFAASRDDFAASRDDFAAARDDFAAARDARTRRRSSATAHRFAARRWLPIAASIAAVLVSGTLFWNLAELRSPAPVHDLGTGASSETVNNRPASPAGEPRAESHPGSGVTGLFSDGFESGSIVAWSDPPQ